MRPYQIVIAVIVVLAVNNIVLLSMLGYFSEHQSPTIETVSKTPEQSVNEAPYSPNETAVSSQVFAANEIDEQNQIELADAVDAYIHSEKFSEFIRQWQLQSNKRNKEITARLANMGAGELYALTLESDNHTEKKAAYYQLIQRNKYKKLSNKEIKSLYASDIEGWGKASLLNTLLERDDSDALTWAKELIVNGQTRQLGGSGDLYSAIYERDPEFIRNHISAAEFDDASFSHELFSFLRNDPDLANSYFSRNFDKIIKSQNDDVFMYGAYGTDIELNQQQQLDLTELLSSKNKRKRRFAMDLIQNIDDTNALRSAYSTLKLSDEKIQFIGGLFQADKNTEQFSLGKELAANSNDSNIKQLANAYSQ